MWASDLPWHEKSRPPWLRSFALEECHVLFLSIYLSDKMDISLINLTKYLFTYLNISLSLSIYLSLPLILSLSPSPSPLNQTQVILSQGGLDNRTANLHSASSLPCLLSTLASIRIMRSVHMRTYLAGLSVCRGRAHILVTRRWNRFKWRKWIVV